MRPYQVLLTALSALNFLVVIVLIWVHAIVGLPDEFFSVGIAHVLVGVATALGTLD